MFRALAGLPLAALVAGVLYLPGGGHGQAQESLRLPPGIQPATGQSPAPLGGRVPGVARPQPRPRSPYEVTDKAPGGPWMVLAANYTCENAEYFATQMVENLRRRGEFAYLWNFADERRRKEEEEYDRLMRQRNPNMPIRRRITRIEEQCGVLIGGYRTLEAANAQLKRIKKLTPPVVRDKTGQPVQDQLITGAEGTDKTTGKMVTRSTPVPISPFVRAFVIRNPALPRQKVDPTTTVDKAWARINSAEEYSLLKCRKNYTLVIKFYQGGGVLQDNSVSSQSGFMSKMFGNDKKRLLQATAVQAHSLADMLTKTGALNKLSEDRHLSKQKVYVFHMRHGSVVTVGGFESLESDDLKAWQRMLSGMHLDRQIVGGDASTATHLQTFTQPLPMKIPKL
jgi:hypothetical protein